MYLNALENQVVPDSEMISLNYLPDSEVYVESNSSRTSGQAQTQTSP